MGVESTTADMIIAGLASRTHGVVTRGELLVAGISRQQIAVRMRRGGLFRMHPGVYRVGHVAPGQAATYTAAVKACGDGAVLSGLAAGWLWGLIRGRAPAPEVTTRSKRTLRGVPTRQSRNLRPEEVTMRTAIPVTTPARTFVDLAPRLSDQALALAFHEAQIKRGLRPSGVEEVLLRHPNMTGARRIRRVIYGDVKVLLSELEARFLGLLRAEGLQLPETNRPAGTRYLDCIWPAENLAVELDSYTFHSSRHAWEDDRRRERLVRARGVEFRRYTRDDVFRSSPLMLAELRGLLGHHRRGADPAPPLRDPATGCL